MTPYPIASAAQIGRAALAVEWPAKYPVPVTSKRLVQLAGCCGGRCEVATLAGAAMRKLAGA